MSRFVRAVLQAQVEPVAGVQLVVVDGLLADEDRVGLLGRGLLISFGGRAAVQTTVLQLALAGDRLRPDAEQVLEVGADVGEAVLERLDRRHAGDLRRAAPWPCAAPT